MHRLPLQGKFSGLSPDNRSRCWYKSKNQLQKGTFTTKEAPAPALAHLSSTHVDITIFTLLLTLLPIRKRLNQRQKFVDIYAQANGLEAARCIVIHAKSQFTKIMDWPSSKNLAVYFDVHTWLIFPLLHCQVCTLPPFFVFPLSKSRHCPSIHRYSRIFTNAPTSGGDGIELRMERTSEQGCHSHTRRL